MLNVYVITNVEKRDQSKECVFLEKIKLSSHSIIKLKIEVLTRIKILMNRTDVFKSPKSNNNRFFS